MFPGDLFNSSLDSFSITIPSLLMGRPVLALTLRVHQPEKKSRYISHIFLHSWERNGKETGLLKSDLSSKTVYFAMCTQNLARSVIFAR